jgi:hypothetical protein
MVGGLAVIASIVRIYALWLYNITKDISYDSIFVSRSSWHLRSLFLTSSKILLLSQIEVNVAIISASAPTLPPLLRNTPLSFSTHADTYGSGHVCTIGSGPPNNNHSSRSRTRSGGPIELMSFARRNSMAMQKSYGGGGRRKSNTSEESILKDEGITKTTETTIDFEQAYTEDFGRLGHTDK